MTNAWKNKMNYNQLTNAETERLSLLMEECAEVIQAASKILRHGWRTEHNGITYDNLHQLEVELGDVGAILHMMYRADDINVDRVVHNENLKRPILAKWLHHQGEKI